MHLANPPTTLDGAIARLTEVSHQLHCARLDNEMLLKQNTNMRDAFGRDDVEILRVDGLDPAMPSTITLRVAGQVGVFKHHA